MDFTHLRKEYQGEVIKGEADPLLLFKKWIKEAEEAGVIDPNSFVLTTASKDGVPSARTVLLKEICGETLLFFSNLESRKAKEIRENPKVFLLFLYKTLSRQILIEGEAYPSSREKSEIYFKTRPRSSQISAWCSKQGEMLKSRELLIQRYKEVESRFANREIPCPPFWGGFLVHLSSIEFWQGMPNRLHDRLKYRKGEEGWLLTRIMP